MCPFNPFEHLKTPVLAKKWCAKAYLGYEKEFGMLHAK